jgi:2-dehydropantoate 2-reductase
MQWVVYGAGAVGGVLGALMYDAGQDVVLVARGAHLAKIRDRGLTVASPTGSHTVRVPAVGAAAEVDWSRPSVVLLAVKSHQTAAALLDLAGAAPADVPIVSLQNGVANEPAALRYFADVHGVCVMLPAAHLEPGVVESHCTPVPGILDVGRFPNGLDDIDQSTAEAFMTAGFVSQPRTDIMAWKHRKLLMNLANAVQACCGSGPAAAELRRLVRAEGEIVLAAAGIPVVSEAEDAARRGDILQTREVAGRPRGGGSTWQSLYRGAGSVESDYLNGEIVLLGRLHGVATPANALLQRSTARLAREQAAPGSLDAAALLAQLTGVTAEPAPGPGTGLDG